MASRLLVERIDTRCTIAATVFIAPHCVYITQSTRSSRFGSLPTTKGTTGLLLVGTTLFCYTGWNIEQSALRVLSVCNVRMLSGWVIAHPHSLGNLEHAHLPHYQQASPVLWTVIWTTHLLTCTHSIQSFRIFFLRSLSRQCFTVSHTHIYLTNTRYCRTVRNRFQVLKWRHLTENLQRGEVRKLGLRPLARRVS
jgi:hypothetical protein